MDTNLLTTDVVTVRDTRRPRQSKNREGDAIVDFSYIIILYLGFFF